MFDGQPLLAKTRVRHDRVDDTGAVTLRNRRQLHHVSLGRRYRGQRVILLVAVLDVRVVTEDGELIRHFTLDPTKNYQQRKDDLVSEGSTVPENLQHYRVGDGD